jgi:hypothetical protein
MGITQWFVSGIPENKERNMNYDNNDNDFKPPCELLGEDSNIFNLLNIATRTLERHQMREKAKEMEQQVYQCHSYSEALAIIMDYVEIC